MGKVTSEVKVWWGKRFWYWLTRSNMRFDAKADPRIQARQALDEAGRQWKTVANTAGTVIGNQKALERELERDEAKLADIEADVHTAIVEVQRAQSTGDQARLEQMESAARAIATDVANQRTLVEQKRQALESAGLASEQARRAAADAEATYQERRQQAERIASKADLADMQKATNALTLSIQGQLDRMTPSLDEVERKVDRERGAAEGMAEIDRGGATAARLEIAHARRNEAAQSILDEIAARDGLAPIKVVNTNDGAPAGPALPAPTGLGDDLVTEPAEAEPVERS